MTAKHHEKTYQPLIDMVEIKVKFVKPKLEQEHHTDGNNINNQVWPKFCQACLSTSKNNLKDMTKKYMYNGRYEIYSEMLDYCFSMQLERNYEEYVRLICESCIRRLREVLNFKIQVEDAQLNIKQNTGISTFLPTSYLDLEKSLENEIENIDNEVSTLCDDDNDKSDDSLSRNHFIETSPPMPVNTHKKKKKSVKSVKKIPDLGPIQCISAAKRVGYKDLPYTLKPDQKQCSECDEMFENHRGLQKHMPTHFPNYTCEICGRVFASHYQFTNHNKRAHHSEIFECTLCSGKRFKTREYFSLHMRAKHGEGVKHNKCSQCGERFNDYWKKQRHLVKVHGAEQIQYDCKLCDATFRSSSARATHIRKAHLNERKHACDYCHYSSFTKRGLSEHILCHTGERNFPCSVCNKRFLRKYTLNEHMKIHTGEKKHVCHICSKAFTQRCSLKGHMAVHERDSFKGDS